LIGVVEVLSIQTGLGLFIGFLVLIFILLLWFCSESMKIKVHVKRVKIHGRFVNLVRTGWGYERIGGRGDFKRTGQDRGKCLK